MTCSFATARSYTAVPSCSLGLSAGKYTEVYNGTTTTYTDGNWQGLLHTVVMHSLTPSQTYFYSCDVGGTGKEYSFKAPVPVGTLPVTLGLIADLGEACDRPGCGNSTLSALEKAASAGEFDVLVHAGDIAYTSGSQGIWDEYMREMEPTAARVPYQVCAGNHEHYFNFSGYRHRFAMPDEAGVSTTVDGTPTLAVNNIYHSSDVGGVHIVGFSTEHDYSTTSEQLAFLRRDLQRAAANRDRVPWIVVYAHRPIYCSTNDYYDCKVAGPTHIGPAIEPLLAEFKVDLFVAGHLHNYERSYPVMNGTVVSTSYENATAPVHVVVGMAGCDEGLTNTWSSPSPSWSVVRRATLGYGRLVAHNRRTLSFEYVLSANGTVVDSFNLTKNR